MQTSSLAFLVSWFVIGDTTAVQLGKRLEHGSIRVADRSDALAVARLQVRSWHAGYRGLLPDDYLNRLSPEERARHYTFGSLDPGAPITIVASEAGLIHGFATLAPARDPDGSQRTESVWSVTVREVRFCRHLDSVQNSSAAAKQQTKRVLI